MFEPAVWVRVFGFTVQIVLYVIEQIRPVGSPILFSPPQAPSKLAYIVLFLAVIFVLPRLGLVESLSAIFFLNTLNGTTLGTDLSTWYAPTGFATIGLMLAIVLYAFRQSLGDRTLPQLS